MPGPRPTGSTAAGSERATPRTRSGSLSREPAAPEAPARAGGRATPPRREPDPAPVTSGRRRAQPTTLTTDQPTTRSRSTTPRHDPDAAISTSGRRRAQAPTPNVPIRGQAAVGNAEATTRVRAAETDSAAGSSRALDRSEQAERTRRTERESGTGNRASHIDETLTRLTAAHAGLTLPRRDGGDEPELPPPAPERRPRLTAARLLAGALALLVFATTTFGWGAEGWLESSIRNAAALDPESGSIVDADTQRGDENVLIVATDAGSNPGAGAGTAGGSDAGADTVTVAHIPAGGGPLVVLSVPNGLEINRPPCERWDPAAASYLDETVPAEARTQLRSALDVGGPRCATRVVQQLTGLAITKYVGIDLDSLGAMADAVGGATVCVAKPVVDRALGPVVPDPGPTTLEGVRAADFARAADVQGDPPSDYGRIERQQQLLAAVLNKAVSGTALLDVAQLVALRPALGKAVVTDGAGLDEVLAMATSLRKLDADGVTFAAVPTTGDANSPGHTVLRDADAAQLFAALRQDSALPEQARDPRAADSGPVPADVKVEVLNASARAGLAGQVGETLSSLGFGVGQVGNAGQPTPQTVIRFSPDEAAAAALLATTVPSATSVPDPGTTGVLQLVLGKSFDDVVRAPAQPIALQADAPSVTPASATCP
ncbi:MAG: cell envelope-related transcriptional attenuator [Pseudonocardia sp.]|nr:cell envelope-related transcriptional attenuator [Pseudonocardia sp.]